MSPGGLAPATMHREGVRDTGALGSALSSRRASPPHWPSHSFPVTSWAAPAPRLLLDWDRVQIASCERLVGGRCAETGSQVSRGCGAPRKGEAVGGV